MSDFVQNTSQKLLSIHKKELVCNSGSSLCVEGFPRSANTFCVDYFMYLCNKNNKKLHLAHHTHSPLNVELAISLKIPCLVLVREPVAALTSYAIYRSKKVSLVAREYMDFYREIEKWNDFVLIADFDVVVKNINLVIERINRNYNLTIPLSTDIEKDNTRVGLVANKRALHRHSKNRDQYIRTVGTPLFDREKLKKNFQPDVFNYIAVNQEIQQRYDSIKLLNNYII